MAKVQLWGYRCERCSHEWLPRSEVQPRVCPKCKSPYWDRVRQSDKHKDIETAQKFTTDTDPPRTKE